MLLILFIFPADLVLQHYFFLFLQKKPSMKTRKIYFNLLALIAVIVIASCSSPVTLTGWKNPDDNTKLSKILVMPLFEKLEYLKPFEQSMCSYFNSKGLKSIGSLDLLNPNIKYPIEDIKRKCDSLGIDAILVFTYKGTDKTESYVPQTTYVSGGYGYGGYYGGGYWGGGYYGGGAYYGGAMVTSTGGYWTTTSVVNVTANLYTRASKQQGMWTGDITVTDPTYIDQSAVAIAQYIYAEWKNYNMLKFPEKK
jgi:hypothetical protein